MKHEKKFLNYPTTVKKISMKNKQRHSLPMFKQPGGGGGDLIKCLKSSNLTEVTTVSKKRAMDRDGTKL